LDQLPDQWCCKRVTALTAPNLRRAWRRIGAQIARVLNARNIATPTGAPWSAMTVNRVRQRLRAWPAPPGQPRSSRGKFPWGFENRLERTRRHGAEAMRRWIPGRVLQDHRRSAAETIDLNVAVDPQGFAERFRSAIEMLGNQPPPQFRQSLRVIDHDSWRCDGWTSAIDGG
jgi:hypothetical protein